MKQPALQPIRVPSGWKIEFNDLFDVDASHQSYDEGFLKEDLLQIKNNKTKVLVDVGWYGGAPPDGVFVIYAHKNNFNGALLERHEVKDKPHMVVLLEELLLKYSNHG